MIKLAIPLALTAVVLVAGCASRATPAPQVILVPQQQPAVVSAPSQPTSMQPAQLRAGYGRVESISAMPTSSGAGSSTAPNAMRRLMIRMEDGTMQYVDTDAPNISVGDRIQLTSDGYIRPA